jgi:hypothetical protein
MNSHYQTYNTFRRHTKTQNTRIPKKQGEETTISLLDDVPPRVVLGGESC